MSVEADLMKRSQGHCELCSSKDSLTVYDIDPSRGVGADSAVFLCGSCVSKLKEEGTDEKAWYALKESMWSEHAPVQVLVYRILRGLGNNPWAQDLLGQLYLDEDTQAWAEAGLSSGQEDGAGPVLDSNGSPLQSGDTVTLIKDLDVKGANFTAKRGTTVKNISLTNDPKYVEGRVNGIRIVLVAAYLKKA